MYISSPQLSSNNTASHGLHTADAPMSQCRNTCKVDISSWIHINFKPCIFTSHPQRDFMALELTADQKLLKRKTGYIKEPRRDISLNLCLASMLNFDIFPPED
jgi:hypothetical protein